MKTYVVYGFLITIIFLIYGKTLNYGFNLDDKLATSIHPSVKKGLKGVPEILSSPYLGKHEPRYGGYRPLARVTFALEYAMFGENVRINHLINLLIYCVSCLLFFHLVNYIFPEWQWWLAGLCSLIFVCHPLHVEVVASLKNREVLLAFFFGIASILMLIKKATIGALVLSVILFFLAAFSKLDAVFFPVFAAFLLFIKDRWKIWQSAIYGILLPVLAVATYFLVQSQFPEPLVFGTKYHENPIVGHQFSLNHFATVAYILAYNIRLIFFPNQFLFFYGTGPFELMHWGNGLVLLSALVHIFILGMMIFGSRKKKTYSLIIIFYFFSIGLYMNLVQLIPGVTGDRFLYTAIGAFSLLFGYVVHYLTHLTKRKILTIASMITGLVFCLYMSVTAYNRADCWESPITLGACDIAQLDNSLTAHMIYLRFLETELKKESSIYDKNHLIKKSITHGYKVLQQAPDNFTAKHHLGYVFCYELDSIKLGGRLLYEALQQAPNNPEVLYNLGLCFEKKGELTNATKFYRAALENEGESVLLKSKLVMAYCIAGDLPAAKNEVDDLVNNFAHHYKSFISEGTYYLFLNDNQQATQSFEKALALKPDLESLRQQIIAYYQSVGNSAKIKQYNR